MMMRRTFCVGVPAVDDVCELSIQPALDPQSRRQVSDKESEHPYWAVSVTWAWRGEDGEPADIVGQRAGAAVFSIASERKPTPAEVMEHLAKDLANEWTFDEQEGPS